MKAARSSIGAMALAGLLLAFTVGLALVAWNLLHVQTPALPPKVAMTWHDQVYGLDPDEVVRFVPPPYSPPRMKDFGRGWAGAPPKNELGQLTYHVLPTRTVHWGMSSGLGNLASGIRWSTNLTSPDVRIPDDLKGLAADGDWITRIDAPVELQMKALESILSSVTGRSLVFEKKMVESDVIVARGTYAFHEDEEFKALSSDRRREKWRPGSVHLYTLPLSRVLGGGGGSGDISQVFKHLESAIKRKFIDEVVEPRPKNIQWVNDDSMHAAGENPGKLDELLAILQKQTSIQFTKERRPMPVWFIREKSATSQPVDGK